MTIRERQELSLKEKEGALTATSKFEKNVERLREDIFIVALNNFCSTFSQSLF